MFGSCGRASFPVLALTGPRQVGKTSLAERPSSKDTSGLRRLVVFYGEKAIAGLFVACSSDAPFTLGDGVNAVPGWTVFDV